MTKEHYLLEGLKNLVRKMNYLDLVDDSEAGIITGEEFEQELKNNEDKYLIRSNNPDESDFTVVFELVDELRPVLREDFTTHDISEIFGIDHRQIEEVIKKWAKDKPEYVMTKAPFSKELVGKLNKYQQSGEFHPYTCGRNFPECEVVLDIERSDTNHVERDYTKDGILVATENGWVCPCGKYKQEWCH